MNEKSIIENSRRTNVKLDPSIIKDDFLYYCRVIVHLYDLINFDYCNESLALHISMIDSICDEISDGIRTDYEQARDDVSVILSRFFCEMSVVELLRNSGVVGYHVYMIMSDLRFRMRGCTNG